MLSYNPIYDEYGAIQYIETSLTGYPLLHMAKLNKDLAFPQEERREFDLLGKLPSTIETLEEQSHRAYKEYLESGSALGKIIYLNQLHMTNETLFYYLISQHLKEMLPLLYHPAICEYIEKFTHPFRSPRGLYLSYSEQEMMEQTFQHLSNSPVDIIIVTDGSDILNLGDQGASGMMIPIAKAMLYCLLAGIHPHRLLPIYIDVGTNNQRLLNDPSYVGWRHPRINEQDYDAYMDKVVSAIHQKYPQAYLHWEDFDKLTAKRNLQRHKEKICTFNNDLQGTGAVTLAALMTALKITQTHFKDHQIVLFGAGIFGVGIAEQLCEALMREGLTQEEALSHLWLVDHRGLLTKDMPDLSPWQKIYASNKEETQDWIPNLQGKFGLLEAIKHIKPTILIGTSQQGGAFSQEIVEFMTSYTERPIIFPLSIPIENAECLPRHLISWTKGSALVATGSFFEPLQFNDKTFTISQCHNAYIFPGIGLGVRLCKAKTISSDMIWQAATVLSESALALGHYGALLPDLEEIPSVSQHIAQAVAKQALKEGLAQIDQETDLKLMAEKGFWKPHYIPYRKID